MQTRKDLLQAHQLMAQRAALALLQGEPDPADQPMRRLNIAMISSVIVAALLTAGFGIWGLVFHGGTAAGLGGTNAASQLILDKETGQAYIWCDDGKLCPAANYASARLALAGQGVQQHDVSQASLAQVPRGPLIGIPGLPPLPDSRALVRQPWSLCAYQLSQTGSQPEITTLVGGQQVGGRPVGNGILLVQAAGQDWAILDGQRMLMQPFEPGALNTTQQPVPVPVAWLNALPEGPQFAPPYIPGAGQLVTGPAGPAKVGQVYHATAAGGTTYYVLTQSGKLAQISQAQARLLEFMPGQPREAPIDPSMTGPTSAEPSAGLPQQMPPVEQLDTATLCVSYLDGAGNGHVTTGGAIPQSEPTGGSSSNSPAGVLADQVAMQPGAAALVQLVSGSAPSPTYFLVIGTHKYPLLSRDEVTQLGYNLSQVVRVNANLIDLIPAGTPLDPTRAKQPFASG